jgi:hypothetical protein
MTINNQNTQEMCFLEVLNWNSTWIYHVPNTCYMPSHSLVFLDLIRLKMFHNSSKGLQKNESPWSIIYDLNISNIERQTSWRLRRLCRRQTHDIINMEVPRTIYVSRDRYLRETCLSVTSPPRNLKKIRNEILSQMTPPHPLILFR